jgi:hypothetical protein
MSRLAQGCLKKFDAAAAHPRDGERRRTEHDGNAHFPTPHQVIGWGRIAQWVPILVSRGHLRSRKLL